MVNGISFSDSLMGSWGNGSIPFKILGTTKGMTMKFLQDVDIRKKAQNNVNFSGL